MKAIDSTKPPEGFMSTALLAGFAGGLAEVVWVGIYCALTPLTGLEVMREVALSVGASALPEAWLPAAGMGVHFALSFAVAVVLLAIARKLLARDFPLAGVLPAAAMALLGIWAMNFLVLLPQLAPRFVELMPAGVSSASKLLFGLAMGMVILRAESRASSRSVNGMGNTATA